MHPARSGGAAPALRRFLALTALAGMAAVYPSARPAATVAAALPADLPVATEAEVQQRCGTVCHKMPPP
jgi:hypothetical protein